MKVGCSAGETKQAPIWARCDAVEAIKVAQQCWNHAYPLARPNVGNLWNARANASAHPPTRASQGIPMPQRAANTEPGPSSAYPFPAGLWRRLTARPLDFQLAVTILRIESSRRSTMTDEKYRPRLYRRSSA